MQSWEWSGFKALEGYEAVRLGLLDGDALRGGAIAYAFPSPAEAGLLVVPDGPLLDWAAPDAGVAFQALVGALRDSPAGARTVALRVEPRLPVPRSAGWCARRWTSSPATRSWWTSGPRPRCWPG
jgi:hypothetical protein